VRVLLLTLAGCTFVNQGAYQERLDQDKDTIPGDEDCSDTRAGLSTMPDVMTEMRYTEACSDELACNTSVECSFVDQVLTEGLLTVSACIDPLDPEYQARFDYRSLVHAVPPGDPERVRIAVTPPNGDAFWTEGPRDPRLGDILLMTNTGIWCNPGTCDIAYPARADASPDNLPGMAFQRDPVDTTYVVVSGNAVGSYQLTMSCD
jgi:hypothetical protein